MKHVNQMRYLYESHVAFEDVSGGIYKVDKDKTGNYPLGGYVTADTVVGALNIKEQKTAVFKPGTIFKFANFEL